MSSDIGTLSLTAFTIGLIHCVSGPDHYVPFVAMSRVGLWSLRKTLLVTLLCGIGHLAGSAILGFVGVALGLILFQLDSVQSWRGDVAAWLLIAFGLIYTLWGIVHAVGRLRANQDGSPDTDLEMAKDRAAAISARAGNLTPWMLFVAFLFGPCEPLVPLLMSASVQANMWNVVLVTSVFCVTTLTTMAALVTLIRMGTFTMHFGWANVYGHVVAGLIVTACGLAILLGA